MTCKTLILTFINVLIFSVSYGQSSLESYQKVEDFSNEMIMSSEDPCVSIAVCNNFSVDADEYGNASINPLNVGYQSTICPGHSITVDQTYFACNNFTVFYPVVFSILDENNAVVASCNALVSVQDPIAPTVTCQDEVNVYLDSTGMASLNTTMFNPTVHDNCIIISQELSQYYFSCEDVGTPIEVVFTARDRFNFSTCSSIVNVFDNIAPVARCVESLTIDAKSSAVVAEINLGSSDNCEIFDMTLSNSYIECENIGIPTVVTLTVYDASGNTSTCNTILTAVDVVNPKAYCQDIGVALVNGEAIVTPEMIDYFSVDNCSIAELTVADPLFTCSNIGSNVTSLIVTDESGNTSECSSIVTVFGEIPEPTISANLNPVYYGYTPQGTSLLTANGGESYMWDNGIPAMAISVTPTETTTYTVTATSSSGCTATASYEVSVIDVRCGPNLNKVLACRVTGNGNTKQVCLSPSAIPALLNQGGYLGTCNNAARPSQNDTKFALDLTFHPNPSMDGNIELVLDGVSNGEEIRLTVVDQLGRLVYHQKLNAQNQRFVDLSNLNPGIYTLNVTSGTETQSKQLSIIK